MPKKFELIKKIEIALNRTRPIRYAVVGARAKKLVREVDMVIVVGYKYKKKFVDC